MLSEETALQFSAIFNLAQNQLLVAIAILAWLVYSVGNIGAIQLCSFPGRVRPRFGGFSTTMLEMVILPLAVLFIGKWTFTKRLPVVVLSQSPQHSLSSHP